MKKRKKLFICALIALPLMSLAAVLCLNPHLLFICGEYLGVSCKGTELTPVETESLDYFTLNELENKETVTFDQSLLLINNENMLSKDFVPSLSEYKDSGVYMNDCIKSSYSELSAAVKEKTETSLYVMSSFRTWTDQSAEYAENPDAIRPGASEHQAGLALDVYVKNYAGHGFLKTEAGRFVNSECCKFGFIIRYPSFGKDKTQIGFEPWHIRYVGQPHAKIIYNNHITLEEYISSLEVGSWYEAEGYLISRQKPTEDGRLALPKNCSDAVISPDNEGNYIITVKNNTQ